MSWVVTVLVHETQTTNVWTRLDAINARSRMDSITETLLSIGWTKSAETIELPGIEISHMQDDTGTKHVSISAVNAADNL